MITKRTLVASLTSLGSIAWLADTRSAPAGTLEGEIVLKAEPAKIVLVPGGIATDGLRFAGSAMLPVLRVRNGQEVVVRIQNGLQTPLAFQWHGLRGRGALDDPATASVPPGENRLVRVTPLDSGTAWFHAAPTGANETARGLRGVIIVEDATAPTVHQDLVAIFEDWLLAADGTLQFGSTPPSLATSLALTTNREPSPPETICAPGSRIRLRLINGSLQRVMLVACEGARPMMLAVDGQPSDLFEPIRDTVPIAPGGRFDYMIDMPAAAGAVVRLILKATERVAGTLEPDRSLKTLRTEGEPKTPRIPIVPLVPNPALPVQIPLEASKRVELVIDGTPGTTSAPPRAWSVNGVNGSKLPAAPILKVKRGETVTLGFINKSTVMVPVRVGGHAMRLLHVKDDGWEPYWRDTVLLPPGSRNHVAFIAGIPGRWPIEAGFEDLAAAGLRCWLEVV